jgi:hypothetical protein
MKIVALTAENIKKLVAVEIKPNGNLVEITGKNGAGKTSVLDSIWWALAGAKHIQAAPIRKGATSARIRLDLGELVVTRTFKAVEGGQATSSIRVENADGFRPTDPQKVLNGMLGALAMDPQQFLRADAKGKFDMLRRFVPEVDFDAIAAEQKADYEKRATLNRRAKEAETMATAIDIPGAVPDAKVNEDDLLQELAQVGEHNGEIEARKLRRETAAKELHAFRTEAEQHRASAGEFRRKADEADLEALAREALADGLAKKIAEAPPLPEPKDAAEVRARLDRVKADNALIDLAARRIEHEERAMTLKAEAEAITEAMAGREKAKQEAIAAAKLPVEGITFGDGEILMSGLPFDQASDAEQLRASLAIAMASNPTLRVIRVRDGSLLDDDAMKILAEEADKHDYQVWIERVDNSGKVGFVLEDGHIRTAPVAEAAE